MSRDYVLQPFHPPVNLRVDYQAELNAQQLAAVTAPPGPSLVIAGAGSGKTRTLTYRVGFLLEQGIPPDRILLLTFTNKAAREMMRRVSDLLGQDLPSLWGGTFHAIGNRMLRQHARRLGYEPDFTIMDREDAKDLIEACLGEAAIDVKAARFPKADVLAEVFSLASNKRQTVAKILDDEYHHFALLAPQIADLQQRYAARKRATNAMDFDDLLELWFKLLTEHADVREQYQRRFQFILVDEYQDTNALQSELIDLLAARHHNVMVVGDDAQSIYAWRGANFLNILKFPERYPEAKVYKIETNYRSTPEILNLANAAIAANLNQFAKELAPARSSGATPVLVTCLSAAEQAAFVAQRVLELREEGVDMNSMAVLYRSHFHALELQLELTRRNIPFSITSGIRFFEQAHIKDATAYLKLVANPRDEIAFKRVVQLLPGIGGKGADKLWGRFAAEFAARGTAATPASFSPTGGEGARRADEGAEATTGLEPIGNRLSPFPHPGPLPLGGGEGEDKEAPLTPALSPSEGARENMKAPGTGVRIAPALQACAPLVPKKAAVPWAQLAATISQLETEPVRGHPGPMLRLVVEAGYEDYCEEHFANYRNRLDDIEQLAIFAQQFPTTEEFLAQLALLTNLEAETEQPANKDDEQLRLSTIHQAKGLEFDVVFVIMLCDGMFPSARSLGSPESEEEERRLLYVAITRARNEIYLSYPLIRMMPGGSGDAMQQPSRFLGEIPEELLEKWDLKPAHPYG
jgi:DNA helicase-2/ATP-dependent DNA helicase PcrA